MVRVDPMTKLDAVPTEELTLEVVWLMPHQYFSGYEGKLKVWLSCKPTVGNLVVPTEGSACR